MEKDNWDRIQKEKGIIDTFGLDWSRKDLFDFNWGLFSELQIQEIISLFYDSAGFYVFNLHKSDRSNEEGADLIIKKGTISIAIAVKLKPKKKDYPQALELSERKEKNKIYYWVHTPTVDFLKKTETIKNVEFKTMKDFLTQCFDKNPRLYFQLVIANNTKLDYYLIANKCIMLKIHSLKHLKIKKIRKLSKESFQELWRLKDIAVELNKTAHNLLTFYENKKITNKELETRIFLSQIKQFELTLSALPMVLGNFYQTNRGFLAYNASANYVDSDWLSYRAAEMLTPEDMENYLKKYNKYKANFQELKITNKIKEDSLNKIFCDILRYICEFGNAFEFRIDNFFNQAIGLPFKRDQR